MVSALILSAGILVVPSDAVEPAPAAADLAAYAAASQSVGRDPAAHIRLALWCEAHGLRAERTKHLALAVLRDPASGMARGLMGLVAYDGQWKRPEAVAEKVKADADLSARLAEYNQRRARAPQTADAQWALGLWCEQNGLSAEALAQFTTVTRLDPSREAARKRLGCKRVGGRWVSEAQLAAEKDEAEAQKKADKSWKPLLTKWRTWLGDEKKRGEAERALADIRDPRAVAAVWSVFVAGSATTHARAVQILGRIDAPAASRALAFLAVFDESPEVRRIATETLRRRDPREFGGLLVSLLRKPIKYQVRPVAGPGSPGVHFVEGKQFNLQRMYAPPPMPTIPNALNQWVTYDASGLPLLTQVAGFGSTTRSVLTGVGPTLSMSYEAFTHFNPSDPTLAHAVNEARASFGNVWNGFFVTHPNNRAVLSVAPDVEKSLLSVSIANRTTPTHFSERLVQIPVGQMMVEAQQSALSAQQQLARDTAVVEGCNEQIRAMNERVTGVLTQVATRDLGSDPESWRVWSINQKGYAYTRPPELPRPTVTQDVPLDYTPQPVLVTSYTQSQVQTTTGYTAALCSPLPSCFGAGTLVRTLEGVQVIESIRVGDRVLTQDIKSGALGYNPVMVIHHNPPSPTFLIKVSGDTIVSSPFHRFWITGKGWIMARDLKGGETVRLLDGPARVESVESGPVQPVFNLDVAEAHDFFAGRAAALVHDNTLPELRLEPFDAVPPLAASAR
jgi:hypothetical protein